MSLKVSTIEPQLQLPEFEVFLRGEEAELLYLFVSTLSNQCFYDKGFSKEQAVKLSEIYSAIERAFEDYGLRELNFNTATFCSILRGKHNIS